MSLFVTFCSRSDTSVISKTHALLYKKCNHTSIALQFSNSLQQKLPYSPTPGTQFMNGPFTDDHFKIIAMLQIQGYALQMVIIKQWSGAQIR